MGVATTRGFEHKHDVSTGGCVAQSREGRSCTRLSNGLAQIPGRSAFLSQSQWVWVVISLCVINHANYAVVQNLESGVLSSLWFASWVPSQPAMLVQLTVAGTMSGDSSAAGYHVEIQFWQSWDSCQNYVSNRPEAWIVSYVLSASHWLILLLRFQRSACLFSEKNYM